jgi:hypothetical protein
VLLKYSARHGAKNPLKPSALFFNYSKPGNTNGLNREYMGLEPKQSTEINMECRLCLINREEMLIMLCQLNP